MYLVIIFAAALLGDCRSANIDKHIKLMEIDRIVPNGFPIKPTVQRRFLTITHRPKESYAHEQGTTLALTCEALGAPAPSVRWFKNDVPVFEYDMESNEQLDESPSSLARVNSTLLVTRSSMKDVYTCLISAGSKTARTSTAVYTYSTDGSTELLERSRLFPLAPHIVVHYKVFVDTIGNAVVLPCRAKGHPRPRVTWTNNNGASIRSDPRMKVLRSGELVISSLRWSDMGEFSCRASNDFGTQLVKTFVYPAKAS